MQRRFYKGKWLARIKVVWIKRKAIAVPEAHFGREPQTRVQSKAGRFDVVPRIGQAKLQEVITVGIGYTSIFGKLVPKRITTQAFV